MKRELQILGLFYLLILFSCNPGARYFRMRKSRGEEFPKDQLNLPEVARETNSSKN